MMPNMNGCELTQAVVERYPAYGFSKVFTVLRREGHPWNHKRVYRELGPLLDAEHRRWLRAATAVI